MQILKLADDLFAPMEEGGKRVTIRKGRRDIALGPLTFEGVVDTRLKETVIVTGVLYCAIEDLPETALHEDGFRNACHALVELRRFYPVLHLGSEVTVVYFNGGG